MIIIANAYLMKLIELIPLIMMMLVHNFSRDNIVGIYLIHYVIILIVKILPQNVGLNMIVCNMAILGRMIVANFLVNQVTVWLINSNAKNQVIFGIVKDRVA